MKTITVFTIALMASVSSMAQVVRTSYQEVRSATDKIEAMEVAFLTQELELTSEEAQKFWPIFNDIKEERNDLKIKKKKLMYDMANNFNTMSLDQAQNFVDGMFDIEAALNESNFEARNRKIIKIIGPKRFLQLKKAEYEFRKKILQEYRTRGR
ncbi:hypothetical protein AAU57_07030 [Nonlabens sp. YIK11]|uniref:hypothetical protein n=1 Tax=Nonlabens sp. YIK11 TaxID=1453349 RepID=UPI0006DCB910|nr:hypothetical protein [Nonlabens sp. YIK11]KQC33096.1 hypothetical protein AAU57_07030 [Nonlabens sp. YIK11]